MEGRYYVAVDSTDMKSLLCRFLIKIFFQIPLLREKGTLISFLYPAQNSALIDELAKRNNNVFAMDCVPRISRAQVVWRHCTSVDLLRYWYFSLQSNGQKKKNYWISFYHDLLRYLMLWVQWQILPVTRQLWRLQTILADSSQVCTPICSMPHLLTSINGPNNNSHNLGRFLKKFGRPLIPK